MTTHVTEPIAARPRVGRSILALLAGFAANVALSLLIDFLLQSVGVLPAPGHAPLNNYQSALAAAYRTLFGVLSAYIVAWLAPSRPMRLALTGAAIGMLLATAGAIATWNKALGPHWYSLVLIALALPTGWLGAKLWLAQSDTNKTAA